MVHAEEVVKGKQHLPVCVSAAYVGELLGKRGPESVIREVQAPRQTVQLPLLQLALVGYLARPEHELH